MTIENLITELQTIGYHLYLDGEQIRYKCLSLIEPPKEKAMPLLNLLRENKEAVIQYLRQGKSRLAYKIYSEILNSFLWVVETDKNAEALRASGVTEPVYTGAEITELKKIKPNKEYLEALHNIKAVFPQAAIGIIKG